MRFASLLGGLAVVLGTCGELSAADKPPDVRTVIAPTAQVWCGPSTSDGLYPTNTLRQGDRVQVEHEMESGWLAIRPPAGSFSWINNRFVQHVSYTNYTVNHENYPVPVFIGSNLKRDRPNKISMKLARGTQVRVLPQGLKMTDEEGVWLPIEPPEGELRYVRAEAVSRPAGAAVGVAATSAKPVTPTPPPDGDTLWRDADKAERTGRYADAIRLYHMAGDANLSVNPSRAEEAYRRANWLEQAQGNNPKGGSYYYPDRTGTATIPNTNGASAFQTIGGASLGVTNGQLVSTSGSPTGGQTWKPHYTRGRLASGYRQEGHQRYRLLDARGEINLWVIAGPGVDLSSHVDKTVELWGNVGWDQRHYLMTATHVREIPQ